jgi:hypothetical protein
MSTQANQLVEKIEHSALGAYGLSKNLKRGFARAGGEDTPLVPTPWPHDFVIGYGDRQRLYYSDLDIFQWVQGFCTIITREPNVELKNLMLEHFRELFHDAQFYGWEAVKCAHAEILSALEYGSLTWFDTLRMADIRRTVVNGKATQARNSASYFGNQNQPAKSAQGYQSQGYQNNAPSKANKSFNKKPAKACNFYNEGRCAQAGDHESASTKWRHVCRECWGRDHTEKDCNFLC